MSKMFSRLSCLLALSLGTLLVLLPSVQAQNRSKSKASNHTAKFYCWDTPQGRQCGDTMPPEAAGASRSEFSSRTGTILKQLPRAKTPEEIEQERYNQQIKDRQAAHAERIKREVATLRMRYDSVEAIRQDFADRRKSLEVGLSLAQESSRSAHSSFVAALDALAGLEMDGKEITPAAFQRVKDRFKEWQERRSGVEAALERLAELDKQLETSIQLWLGVPTENDPALNAPPATPPSDVVDDQ